MKDIKYTHKVVTEKGYTVCECESFAEAVECRRELIEMDKADGLNTELFYHIKKWESELDKALRLLKPLLNGMAEDRGREVEVYTMEIHNEPYIVVRFDGSATYKIPVAAENMRSMIKSVVDAVALKF